MTSTVWPLARRGGQICGHDTSQLLKTQDVFAFHVKDDVSTDATAQSRLRLETEKVQEFKKQKKLISCSE